MPHEDTNTNIYTCTAPHSDLIRSLDNNDKNIKIVNGTYPIYLSISPMTH